MARLNVAPPQLPPPPQDQERIYSWANRLYAELTRFFSQADLNFPDGRLLARVTKQLLVPGFSIVSAGYYIDLYSNVGPVVSDHATAITLGVEGQTLVIQNRSADTVTIVNGALTRLAGGVDYVMTTDDTLTVRWDGSFWTETARSVS